jgi:hypothetical protein
VKCSSHEITVVIIIYFSFTVKWNPTGRAFNPLSAQVRGQWVIGGNTMLWDDSTIARQGVGEGVY